LTCGTIREEVMNNSDNDGSDQELRLELFKERDITEFLKILPANSLSFSKLYKHYEKTDFLYLGKKKWLTPNKDLIQKNWEKGWRAGREILWTLAFKDTKSNKIGTVTSWRNTRIGWLSQHLTSEGNPVGVISILLSAQGEGILMKYNSGQNWYSPENKYATKLYSKMVNSVGLANSSSTLFNYLEIDPEKIKSSTKSIRIVRCVNENRNGIGELAKKLRGRVYYEAEELAEKDIELLSVDEMYKKHGLRRKRYMWLAFFTGQSEPVGAVLAYRGPFGFSFSFLENRCDLLVDEALNEALRGDVCEALIKNAAMAYFDSDLNMEYPLKHIVVIADDQCAKALENLGVVVSRQYYQNIWLREGFLAWHNHIEKIFERVVRRVMREDQEKDS